MSTLAPLPRHAPSPSNDPRRAADGELRLTIGSGFSGSEKGYQVAALECGDLSSGVRERLDDPPTQPPLEVAVGVESQLPEPRALLLLRRAPQHLEEVR
jgi:hypothetical protein